MKKLLILSLIFANISLFASETKQKWQLYKQKWQLYNPVFKLSKPVLTEKGSCRVLLGSRYSELQVLSGNINENIKVRIHRESWKYDTYKSQDPNDRCTFQYRYFDVTDSKVHIIDVDVIPYAILAIEYLSLYKKVGK